jgi:DNA recombination protein RmuC
MSIETVIIVSVLILGFSLLIWVLNRKLSNSETSQSLSTLTEWLKSTQTTLINSDKNVTDTLQKSYQEMNARLDHATRVIGDLKLETGKFTEIGRSMKDLQDFLNSPKLRGNLGEQILGDLLAQVLPQETFSLQYHFHTGEIVDAVIKTAAGLIPIDSKFPMENFIKLNQAETKKDEEIIKKLFIADVKKHLKAISDKYIKTAEHTVDFALMYIPSETMYYEITAHTTELTEYAQTLRVLPVSPATFYAFLRTILVSFEGQRIQDEAQNVLQNLRDIQKSANDFNDKLQVLGRHVTNAYNNMNAVSADFNQLQTKINTTRSLGTGISKVKELV